LSDAICIRNSRLLIISNKAEIPGKERFSPGITRSYRSLVKGIKSMSKTPADAIIPSPVSAVPASIAAQTAIWVKTSVS